MARRRSALYSMAREIERANRRAIAEQNRINKQRERERKALERQNALLEKENAIKYADVLTKEAEDERYAISGILNSVSSRKLEFNWEKYKDNSKFEEKLFQADIPVKPNEDEYKAKNSLVNLFIPSRKTKEQKKLSEKFEVELQNWKKDCESIEEANKLRKDEWLDKKSRFEEKQSKNNAQQDEIKKGFENGEKEAIEFYYNEVLSNNNYPEYFDLDWEIEYNDLNKMLIIEYELPKKSDIPNLKQVKYIQTRKEYKQTYLKDTEINKIYEDALYKLCLRVNYDIYIIDNLNYIEGIVFNGYLTDINKSNGIEETKCIISLQTEKVKFLEINLGNVDAKLCFKSLKGIAGAKLSDLVAVAPIVNIDSNDKRFVESREIGETISGYNLALMNWEDFEHLVREVFEKEFSKEGAEVKITQASRDGGVDAVIFDPDPIKGGKYIVQAKRYTNVVGVSAVRDLYGTVMNEGASKGILVTTSDYGRDSYEFAKDKPITLLNGSNLLHILKKYGYEARIDLTESKININSENSY